jgi:hypothetical protein
VLRTKVPTAGALAHRARDIRTVDNEHQGTEQNYGFRKAPVLVHRLFLQKPERLEAWGRIVVLALRLWRLMERTRRTYVAPPARPCQGGTSKRRNGRGPS